MTRNVRFHSHACLTVEGEREVLLTDPWLFGDVFNGSWSLRPAPDIEALRLDRIRHIWLSHEHPDHLHVPSLRLIRERCAGPLTVYYRRTPDGAVRDALAGLGFDVVELVPHQETPVADDISITLFTTREDSALVIRLGERIILNQNDCSLARGEVDTLTRMFPSIDGWFFQFSLGGYCANADDPNGLEAARRYHIRKVARYHAALRPRAFVPFASFFRFSKEGNAFLNEWSVTPAQVVEALPDVPTQVLRPGDAVLWREWQARNEANLAWWTATLRGPARVKPHARVAEGAIVEAARAVARSVRARGVGRYGPGETHLEVQETGHAVAVDLRRGRADLVERADPRRIAITAPGEELLFFFSSPYGDSMFFGSNFRVRDAERWRRLREFMRCRHTASAVRFCIASLDRRLLGARLTGLYRRFGRDQAALA